MKIALTYIAMSLLGTSFAFSQSWYWKVTGDYGTSAFSNSTFQSTSGKVRYTGSVLTGATIRDTILGATLGRGFGFGLVLGKAISGPLSFELGVDYTISRSLQTGDRWFSPWGAQFAYRHKYSSNLININPTLVFSTVSAAASDVYLCVGALMGFPSLKKVTEYEGFGNESEEWEFSYHGNVAWGLNVGAGVQFPINSRMLMNIGVNLAWQRYAPKERTTDAYTENGLEALSTLDESDRKTIYSDEPNYNYRAVYDSLSGYYYLIEDPLPNDPQPSNTLYFPYGSFKVGVGIRYDL